MGEWQTKEITGRGRDIERKVWLETRRSVFLYVEGKKLKNHREHSGHREEIIFYQLFISEIARTSVVFKKQRMQRNK